VFGELVVVDDVPATFADVVARRWSERGADRTEGWTLVLSGGDTARRCYEALAARTQLGRGLDLSTVDLLWGDERLVPLDDADSNHRLVQESLLARGGRPRALLPMTGDVAAYEREVRARMPLDVVHLGLGPDGHTMSAFPGVELGDGLVVRTSDPTGANPHPRMTLTFEALATARLVVVTVEGEAKRAALDRVRAGDLALPASRIRAEEVVWICDRAAAGAEGQDPLAGPKPGSHPA
jgi:6-phosphogluconolactonase